MKLASATNLDRNSGERTPDSCYAALDMIACAAFCKESRMTGIQGQRRDLRCPFLPNEGPPSELEDSAQTVCSLGPKRHPCPRLACFAESDSLPGCRTRRLYIYFHFFRAFR
jgi:hypothetical protein